MLRSDQPGETPGRATMRQSSRRANSSRYYRGGGSAYFDLGRGCFVENSTCDTGVSPVPATRTQENFNLPKLSLILIARTGETPVSRPAQLTFARQWITAGWRSVAGRQSGSSARDP